MKRKQNAISLISVIFLALLARGSTFRQIVFGTCDSSTQYTCRDLTCIDKAEICDETLNCPDGSDELPSVCEYHKCWAPKFFKCGDGKCVHTNTSLCDGVADCSDGSDERHCSVGTPTETTYPPARECMHSDEFRCSDDQCVPKSWLCDGYKDCANDETDGCNLMKCEDDEFMCTKKKKCIPKSYRCDGTPDCSDGTDEEHCDKESRPINTTHCTKNDGKFACRDNLQCIDLSMVCDGTPHCHDKSDEDTFCQILKPNKCANCTHRCIETPSGSVMCVCDRGYKLTKHDECVDENECETYGICDQKCVNLPGSYHCACDPDYVLQIDGRSCFVKEGEAMLVYTVTDAIKGITLKSRAQRTFFENIPFTVGVSAIGTDLYFSSIENGSQSIVKASEFGDQQVIITNGLGRPEDVAVDWITRNIYFSDNKYKRIVACSDDGNMCAVLHTTVDKPRSIALIPEQGLMFWTDWGKKPHIGRSGMDGSDSMNFVTEELTWPNGLAIDLPNERLYWVDAKIERVETIRLDQTDRRIILSESVKHPFGLAVFENKLYWSDRTNKEIHSCDKFTGKDRQSITREGHQTIHGITIQYPPLAHKWVENPCRRHPCSDLCLLAPHSTGSSFTCACPSNKHLSLTDSSKCVETHKNPVVVAAERNRIHFVEHKAIGHPVLKSHHLSDEFHITAIAYNQREDTLLLANLPSRSIYAWSLRSETVTPLITHGIGPISSMEYDEFGNNLYFCDEDSLAVEAISLATSARSVILNGVYPEFPISLSLAPEHGFMFVIYVRVAVKVHIDRVSMDGSEVSRKHIVDVNVRGSEVKLHFNRELEKLFWVDVETGDIESVDIHGNNRVKLFAKELTYGFTSVGSILFWTNQRSPILNSFDFYVDEYSKNLKLDHSPRSQKEFLLAAVERSTINSSCLANNGGCSHLCLASHEKELRQVCACPAGYSVSTDGRTCIKPKACSLDQFQCFTGECIPSEEVCDNKKDCIHGEDEDLLHCNGPKCPPEQFLCFDQSRCVDRKAKCDEKFDCDDKSDEVCNVNCTKNQFACDSGECIDLHFRCDGKVDCRDAQDELHCTLSSCAGNEFQCASGQCVPKEWECDKEPDCVDGSDEWSACELSGCFDHEFKCNNQKCIDMSLTCNGFNDCGDDSDEFQCFLGDHHRNVHKLCSSTEFFCMSNEHHCVPISARCNGTKECVRGEDEEHCSNENPCIPEREFFCAHDNICVPTEWVCDSHNDCKDGSDETKNACFNKPAKDQSCSGFKCHNGECIALSQVCDLIPNCSDKSDEGEKCHIKCEEFGCSQKCFPTPNGPVCKCKNGYELSSDSKTCNDVNECDMNICAQHCENTMGGFSCGCYTPEYRLRADRVSCKALGPSFIYVVASRTTLFMTTNNMKHTSQISLGKHLFSYIRGLDVDVMHNYAYVLLENDVLERISVMNGNKKQLIAPQITDFTVDWMTEAVFTVHGYRSINVTNFNLVDEKKQSQSIRLYEAEENHLISTLSVDPVAGYLFWFETHPNLTGSIRRADCTGANIITLHSELTYPVRQLVVESFNKHLYWFDPNFKGIHRMNYDGSGNETVLLLGDEVSTFTFFENSIYSISPNLLTVRKCRIYGLSPKKCEMIKLNTHRIRHLSILQQNRHRTGQNPCEERPCPEYGTCLMSPNGPQCVCPDGNVRDEKTDCSKDGSFSLSTRIMGDNTFGKYFTYFVVLCAFAGIIWFTFSHLSRRKGEILHRLHFHNPVYEIPSKSKAREGLMVNAEEHSYDTPICEAPKSVVYNSETSTPEIKTHLPTIEESNYSECTSDHPSASKELLFVNTI